ncbi:MAG: hypothetical protein IJI22_03795 [Bacilli bacterium]|nr:hypothetical protein [Bacilli bacterium]
MKEIIINNPTIYNYLRDQSYQYKYLYRNKNYIKKLKQLAKEKYKVRSIDKIERLKNSIELINTFIDVIE